MARSRREAPAPEPDAPTPDDDDDEEGAGVGLDLNHIAESADWTLYHKNEYAYARQNAVEPLAEGEVADPAAPPPPYTVVKLGQGEPTTEEVDAATFEKEWVNIKGPTKDVVPPAPRRQDALDALINKAAAKAAAEQQAVAAA